MESSLFLANPSGLWMLLGLPLVALIHFFQQPSRRLEISTFFLLEAVPPESLRGKTFEKFRQSLPLWLQLLAVVLLAWLLSDPRWRQPRQEQRVLLLLDSSASMGAFTEESLEALEEAVATLSKEALRTNWTLMETYPGAAKLYEGGDASSLLQSAGGWTPRRPRRDFKPVLDLAAAWQEEGNTVLLISDGQEESQQPAGCLLVGRPLDNAGIVGAGVRPVDGIMQWSAVIRNFSTKPVERGWRLRSQNPDLAGHEDKAETKKIRLDPGGSRILSGMFPSGQERLWLELEPDAFALDDRLPLLIPRGRTVGVCVQAQGKAAGFFKKLLEHSPGARLEPDESLADVLVTSSLTGYSPAIARKNRASIVLRQRRETADRLESSPVTAERHPLVRQLAWQGLLSSGPEELSLEASDQVLVWHKGLPLVFLRLEGAPSLMLNFDFEYSNADRLPAVLVMIHRFLEGASRALPGYRALNLLPGQSLRLDSSSPETPPEMLLYSGDSGKPARLPLPADSSWMAAPEAPGFFQVNQGKKTLLDGAVQFLDPFESDFSRARTEKNWQVAAEKRQQSRSLPDPLRPVWLLLLGSLFFWMWWIQPERSHAL